MNYIPFLNLGWHYGNLHMKIRCQQFGHKGHIPNSLCNVHSMSLKELQCVDSAKILLPLFKSNNCAANLYLSL